MLRKMCLRDRFWDNGQIPLTKTADYTGTQGGTTPIYLTEEEFKTQFKERKNQFFLDKSRTYLVPKTAKGRYAVTNILFQSNGNIDDSPRIDYIKQHLQWLLKSIEDGEMCIRDRPMTACPIIKYHVRTP